MMAETAPPTKGKGDVDVPGVGKVKKTYVIGGVLVVGTLIGVYYYRKSQSSAAAATTTAAAAATTTDQYPPDGTVGNPQDLYSTDPATNQTYGDEAVGAGTYGAYTSSDVGSTGIIGYDSSGNPVYAPGYNQNPTGTTTGPPFSNNSEWSNYVITQMQAINFNIDVGALTDAIGAYLAGQPLTPPQQTLVFDARGVGGDPPVAGANGYPPSIKSAPGGGGATPGTCPTGYKYSSTQTNTPGEVAATGGAGWCELIASGGGTPPPTTKPSVSGGHVVSVSATGAVVAWTGRNAARYNVKLIGPGPENGRTNTVTSAQATYSGLEHGHDYQVEVVPIAADLHTEGTRGVIAFKTK